MEDSRFYSGIVRTPSPKTTTVYVRTHVINPRGRGAGDTPTGREADIQAGTPELSDWGSNSNLGEARPPGLPPSIKR